MAVQYGGLLLWPPELCGPGSTITPSNQVTDHMVHPVASRIHHEPLSACRVVFIAMPC
jgi:hypothetical protein